jgi:hypothetical protein
MDVAEDWAMGAKRRRLVLRREVGEGGDAEQRATAKVVKGGKDGPPFLRTTLRRRRDPVRSGRTIQGSRSG